LFAFLFLQTLFDYFCASKQCGIREISLNNTLWSVLNAPKGW
jgi:hypothetical protein